MQIERVTALLEELRDVSDSSSPLLPAMLARTRTSIRNAERILGLGDDTTHRLSPILEQEGDPQPEVDRVVLDRLFKPQDQYQ